MGVADRTLKTFDYISKGLLPLDDSLSRSEEETLEEQILDRCVREEWEEAEVTPAARRRQTGKRSPRGRGRIPRIRCSLEKESSAVSLVIGEQDWSLLLPLLSVSLRNLLRSFYLSAARCLCLQYSCVVLHDVEEL